MSGTVERAPVRAAEAGSGPVPQPVVLRPWVSYAKDDVVEVCGALALAEVLLRRLGHPEEAARMAAVFDVVEAGLAG